MPRAISARRSRTASSITASRGNVGLTATVPTHAIICSIHDWVRPGGEWEVIVDPRGLVFTSESAEPEVC